MQEKLGKFLFFFLFPGCVTRGDEVIFFVPMYICICLPCEMELLYLGSQFGYIIIIHQVTMVALWLLFRNLLFSKNFLSSVPYSFPFWATELSKRVWGEKWGFFIPFL